MSRAGAPDATGTEKRSRPPTTVDDVCDFLSSVLAGDTLESAVAKVREEEIDGEALLTLAEKDIREVLGVTKFGPVRKLWARLQALNQVMDPEEGGATKLPPNTANNNGGLVNLSLIHI